LGAVGGDWGLLDREKEGKLEKIIKSLVYTELTSNQFF
jgi:hypothetical protein